MGYSAWGVSWLGSWGDSWGPIHEVEEDPHNYYGKGRANRPLLRRYEDPELIRQVNEKWEAIDRARQEDANKAAGSIQVVEVVHVNQVLDVVHTDETTQQVIPVILNIDTERVMPSKDMALAPLFPDQAKAAIEARRKNNNEALMLMLLDM